MQTCTQKMLHLIVHNFRNRRVSTDAIKSRCVLPSSTCGISNERTRSCHDDCKGVTKKKIMENQRKLKKLRMMKIQIVRTTQMFFHLLRQLQIINKCWHWNLYQEAAMSLLHKDLATNTKATVHFNITCHFDTTSRSNIDGEWPSIILYSSAPICKEYQLQPLFLAYEDCE